MTPDLSFDELVRQVGNGDEQAAGRLVRDFEPFIRRVLRARLRGPRARQEFDSMDICQSVFAIFFVRVAAGQFDLRGRPGRVAEPADACLDRVAVELRIDEP